MATSLQTILDALPADAFSFAPRTTYTQLHEYVDGLQRLAVNLEESGASWDDLEDVLCDLNTAERALNEWGMV